jgi:hypothetical protein
MPVIRHSRQAPSSAWAYAGALLQNAGLAMVAAWICAALVVALFAVAVGFAILRMKGHYFAVGSITLVEVLRLLTSYWSSFTGGGEGLNLPILPGGPDFAGRVFLYAMLAVMVSAFAATVWVDRSRLGFGLRCIEQNEDAADMVGVDVDRYKIAAFALSAVFCGPGRRDLGLVGRLHRAFGCLLDPVDPQGAGDGDARRCRHRPRAGTRRGGVRRHRTDRLGPLPGLESGDPRHDRGAARFRPAGRTRREATSRPG